MPNARRPDPENRLIDTGDVKKGVIIELDGQLMKVLDWTHIKMARGSAQVRMKLQNVRRGDIVERTFQAGTRWPRVPLYVTYRLPASSKVGLST